MKNLYVQYKPFFIFLIKFLLLYIVLTVVYKFYLNQYDAEKLEVDGLTTSVALQVEQSLLIFDQPVTTKPSTRDASVVILLRDKPIARVIEGCNAISIMILFAAFIFAFSSKWKKTLLYIVIGIGIIHILNVLRITLLTIALDRYPKQQHLLHGVVFPLFIYGVVFLLWILWVQKFSGYAAKNVEK
ncbi:exosortase family protein XrtF [Flavobacterium cerinum]|uniref:Exosortase family protein XrtF n=1 Tax=Flavobacterium cerinum TaxID=2502784 RepID=A0ABY5ITW6_9FLAO|nr:exosortase family protein XrtF [Flavobacterium cerinum]UUC45740.1 exosortase family protein XrtF [Flavobacterium cerinum]